MTTKVCGSLQAMPVSEALMWISQCRKTGTLEIRTPSFHEKIAFVDGFLIYSSSSDLKSTFGRLLIRKGVLTEEQHEQARKIREDQEIALAKVLRDMHFLPEDEILRLLRKKAEAELFQLFRVDQGEFEFVADRIPDIDLLPMRVDVAKALLRVTQQIDEKEEYDFDESGIRLEMPKM